MHRALASVITSTLALTLVAGCDDGHDHGDDPLAEACEHAVDGPFRSVQAADAASAPAIQSFVHARVDVALPDADGGRTGSVAFNATEAGDVTFYLTADVPLAVAGPDGPLAIDETTAVDDCDGLAVAHTVALPPGLAILTLGPTDAEAVGLVFEAGERADE